jgi:polysaccharide chain length determinant protein (PEP-CTERM system associated)
MTQQVEVPTMGFGDYMAVLARRKWRFSIPLLLVLGIGIALAILLPPTYKSEATLLVERQEIPEMMVGTTVTGFVQERIESVSKKVRTQKNLIAIAKKYSLYDKALIENDPGSIARDMRDALSVEMLDIEATDPGKGRMAVVTVAFTIAFEFSDAQKAKNVVDEVARLFIDENKQARMAQSAEVARFLDNENEKRSGEIAALENKLADFKSKHDGLLPEQIDVARNRLDRLGVQLTSLEESIRTLNNQRRALTGKLSVTPKYLGFDLDDESGVTQSDAQKLAAAKQELRVLKQKYSDIHPDIIRLKSIISNLEKQAGQSGSQLSGDATNPEYINLKAQLSGINSDLDAETRQKREIEEKMDKYNLSLMRAPGVEKELNAIVRELSAQQHAQNLLKERQLQAKLATTLEEGDKGQKFTMLEEASTPTLPESPNRIGIVLLSIFLGGLFGIFSVIMAEMSDKTIRSARQLQAIFNSPPIAAIPFYEGLETRS